MTLLRKAVADSLDVRHYPCLTVLEREEPTKVVLQHLRDVLDRHPRAWDSERSKTRVLAITGVKGCGKTRLMKHLAGYAEDRPGEKEKENRNHGFTQHLAQKKQPGPIESSGVGGKAVVVSLNEAARIDHMVGKRGRELSRSFGVLLLAYNKVPLEIAELVASFDEAILLVRESLELSATEPLTVLVDEIIMLKDLSLNEGKDWQVTELVTYLKKYQDETITENMPPVLFVFSSMTEQYMTACATASGRVVDTVNLECLSDDSATLSLLPDDVRKCINKHGALQALYKSLGGHPRAITEGLALIPVDELERAVDSPSVYRDVQRNIITVCKLNLISPLMPTLHKQIPLWMSFNFDAECNREHKERMRLLGYLQRKDGTEVLMPLLLRYYALSWGDAPLKAALRGCYDADSDLWKGDNEKRAESLMVHWEMVLKLANLDGAKRGVFFAGAQAKDPAFLDDVLTWPRPPAVKNVESFASIALSDLKAGTTLVSENAKGAGVQYVTTFDYKKGENKKEQEAALVQVKFGVEKGPAWGNIQDNMQDSPARKAIDELQVACSYIVYTTYANGPPMDQRSERFLYFNHAGLKEYTAKLGPLKLHECTVPKTDWNPASSVLRSWRSRWDTTRALPAVQQAWLPLQLPLAAPRNTVNLLLLRRAAKVFG